MNDFNKQMPKMLAGMELKDALTVLPAYDEAIREKDITERLLELSNIYNIYIPSAMSVEIYNKLYLSMVRSLQKKGTKEAVQQRYSNFNMVQNQKSRGIIGGSDSFTIIGCSGIGKSSAIAQAITLATENKIIELQKPYCRIAPCIICQCPHDCSVKGLLLEVLRKLDETIGSEYYDKAMKSRATTDMLIGYVSQASLNHIGLLVVDEIQNVCNHKSGIDLVGMLTQLINNSGISICMVGTPNCIQFFESEMQLARRSLGLRYGTVPFDDYFRDFCKTVFSYQYVKNQSVLTDSVVEWLYEHSAGVISIVISLIYDAQEVAILNGTETINLETLREAYESRFGMMDRFIQPSIIKNGDTTRIKIKKNKKIVQLPKTAINMNNENFSYYDIAMNIKKNGLDAVQTLSRYISITEVAL